MNFSGALAALHEGKAVRRESWADGMYAVQVPGSTITVAADRPLGKALPHLVGTQLKYNAHFGLVVPGEVLGCWNVMDVEINATDWLIHQPGPASVSGTAEGADPSAG